MSVGTALSRSPAATAEVLEKLAATTVTAENWRLLAAQLDCLDIPQKQEITAEWKRRFEPSGAEESAPGEEINL